MRTTLYCAVLAGVYGITAAGYGAMASWGQELPDAPSAASAGESSSVQAGGGQTAQNGQAPTDKQAANAGEGVQTKRILGIIPNFRSVSADTKLPPLSMKEKFTEATQDTFDYSALVLPLTTAALSYGSNSTPEFGSGGLGYGRYLWHAVADQTVENYLVEFIGPVVTHEDPRYYTKGHGGFVKRAEYSLSRAVITRTDSGGETFNFSEVVGAGAAAGISNFYYPGPERTLSNTLSKWGENVGIDAFTFVAKEFWPDINKAIFHGKQ